MPDVPANSDPFLLAGRLLASRLILGTGRYETHEIMRDSLALSGAK